MPEIIGMQSLNALVERLQDVSNRLGRVDHEVTGPGPENDAEQRGKPVEGHLLARMADALVCVERNVSSLERATGLGAPAASQATAYRA
jgi:hypothetical protein